MREFRNPRYAPEFLERKLSPSNMAMAFAPAVVMAPVNYPTPSNSQVVSMVSGLDVSSIDFPPPPPPPPAGPTLPAVVPSLSSNFLT
jgi:hypothetical protein